MDNTHLLDATEIFRKLNVHKKVSIVNTYRVDIQKLTRFLGIIYKAWVPPCHVLFLPLQHDRGPDQGRDNPHLIKDQSSGNKVIGWKAMWKDGEYVL
jgi:hypothetical protein